MKTGHYHSQNFYEIDISVEKLLSRVLCSCTKVSDVITLRLVWERAGFCACRCGAALSPDALL